MEIVPPPTPTAPIDEDEDDVKGAAAAAAAAFIGIANSYYLLIRFDNNAMFLSLCVVVVSYLFRRRGAECEAPPRPPIRSC